MYRTPRLLILPLLLLLVLPAYCDTPPELVPVTVKYQDGVPQGDQSLIAVRIPNIDELKAIADPGNAVAVGYGRTVKVKHPDVSRVPGRLAIAGLILSPLDRNLEKMIRPIDSSKPVDGITNAVNSLGTPQVLVPALAASYFLGSKADKDTAEMAVSALASAAIMTQGMKYVTGRARPNMTDAGQFSGPNVGSGHDSFPSGHTAAAFAVATVLANRHPEQKWLYYGLATAVGVARVRKSAHFPSDVLVGAAVGVYAGNRALEGTPKFLSIRF